MKHTLACSTAILLTLAACGSQQPAEVVNKNTLNYQKSEQNPSFALAMSGRAQKGRMHGVMPADKRSAYHASDEFYDGYGIQMMPKREGAQNRQAAAQRFEYDPSFEAAPTGGGISVSEIAPIEQPAMQEQEVAAAPVVSYAPGVEEPTYLEPMAPITSVDVSTGSVMDSQAIVSADFIWPTQGRIVSGFGPKESGLVNDGINIAADAGEPIWAAADGEVAYVGNELKGYGNMLIVRHDDGWMSAYAHAKNWSVGKGIRVKQGQLIGYVGQSGGVAEPQLHFGLRQNKTPVDPTGYLPQQVASR